MEKTTFIMTMLHMKEYSSKKNKVNNELNGQKIEE